MTCYFFLESPVIVVVAKSRMAPVTLCWHFITYYLQKDFGFFDFRQIQSHCLPFQDYTRTLLAVLLAV
jgi:hypothetical protein